MYRSERVILMIVPLANELNMLTEEDCQKCGACCSEFCDEELECIGRRGVGLYIGDDPLPDMSKTIKRKMIVAYESPLFTDQWLRGKIVNGVPRCKALEGEIGKACSCTIYPMRPQTCRDFSPGSDRCLEIRKKFGIDKIDGENSDY